MSHRWKPIVACLSLILFATAGGCGGSGDKSPPAAIGEAGKDGPSGGGGHSPGTPKSNVDLQHPVVLIETSLGNITVQLDREKAKLTVGNFLVYVGESFYDQTIIHQVYKGQGILAGGYGANMVPKRVHQTVRNEADNRVTNARGTIAMVRQPDAIDSATSQFFINVADNPSLDYKGRKPEEYGYCVFGKVIEGMEVVDKINALPLHDTPEMEQTPTEQVVVKSIRLIR